MPLVNWITGAALSAGLLLSGCSAAQSRIDEHQELFGGYSPEDQALIQSNRIAPGFDGNRVYLALGNPDRTISEGGAEVWHYYRRHSQTVQEELSAGEYRAALLEFENAKLQGKAATQPSTHRVYRVYRTAVERVVRFEGGVVESWEEPEELWVDDWHP